MAKEDKTMRDVGLSQL